ncbi:MAG: hypothetical protein JWQ25_1668, partial [Daejeonella sp.]|nr:hypothetical protein [Daejeonella sp.]
MNDKRTQSESLSVVHGTVFTSGKKGWKKL